MANVNVAKGCLGDLYVKRCNRLKRDGFASRLHVLINLVTEDSARRSSLLCRKFRVLFNQLFSKQEHTELSQSLAHSR